MSEELSNEEAMEQFQQIIDKASNRAFRQGKEAGKVIGRVNASLDGDIRWDLGPCTCKDEYSIERTGDRDKVEYTLFLGRCGHKHGLNLCRISEVAFNFDAHALVERLNYNVNQIERDVSKKEATINELTDQVEKLKIDVSIANQQRDSATELADFQTKISNEETRLKISTLSMYADSLKECRALLTKAAMALQIESEGRHSLVKKINRFVAKLQDQYQEDKEGS